MILFFPKVIPQEPEIIAWRNAITAAGSIVSTASLQRMMYSLHPVQGLLQPIKRAPVMIDPFGTNSDIAQETNLMIESI